MAEQFPKRKFRRALAFFVLACGAFVLWFVVFEKAIDAPNISSIPSLEFGQRTCDTHCARCHGRDRAGLKIWHTDRTASVEPPPALDGSGESWKLSQSEFAAYIRGGDHDDALVRLEYLKPPFHEAVSESDVKEIHLYIRHSWPREIRKKHFELHKRF